MIFTAVLLAAASPCAAAQTQTDLNQCWSAQASAAVADLRAAYAKLVAGMQKLGIDPKPLVSAQGAWVGARDATCEFEESLYQGGTIAPMIGAECFDRMTRARTAQLQTLAGRLGALPKLQPVSPAADAELNRVYGLLLKQLTAKQRKAAVASEVAWLSYRDKACPLEGDDCLTALERERTEELKAGWLGEAFW